MPEIVVLDPRLIAQLPGVTEIAEVKQSLVIDYSVSWQSPAACTYCGCSKVRWALAV